MPCECCVSVLCECECVHIYLCLLSVVHMLHVCAFKWNPLLECPLSFQVQFPYTPLSPTPSHSSCEPKTIETFDVATLNAFMIYSDDASPFMPPFINFVRLSQGFLSFSLPLSLPLSPTLFLSHQNLNSQRQRFLTCRLSKYQRK